MSDLHNGLQEKINKLEQLRNNIKAVNNCFNIIKFNLTKLEILDKSVIKSDINKAIDELDKIKDSIDNISTIIYNDIIKL